ncbi:MAG: hypothetical protein LUH22_13095 [Bacteroides sp.]|nr:hypothetical protein [Bacteroides sp.]
MNPFLIRGANLELYADSVSLKLLPLKDSVFLYKGDQVVVAEFEVHPEDLADSLWVKLAHSEEIQGWIRQKDLAESFVPTETISQFIHFFSNAYLPYFIAVIALFVCLILVRLSCRKRIPFVLLNDIDSLYPLFLCLLMSVSATLYESIQLFAPEMWQYYFFNPTLSPIRLPGLLACFLISVWAVFIVGLTTIEEAFRHLSPGQALLYLLGLLSACIICYLFFVWSTPSGIGYVFLLALIGVFIFKVATSFQYKYKCGNCGSKMKKKGKCSVCDAVNE